MKTIILNGSPKGNVEKSGSYFLAKAFVSEMEQPCEIRSISKEDTESLIKYIEDFDNVIIFTPNYVHAVPGGVIKFFEKLHPANNSHQSFGLVIQAGYPETAESEIISRYFADLMRQLNYNYLGTVAKGECAGIAIMPKMFKKLAKRFAAFGLDYEQTGSFSEKYIKEFAKPYELSKSAVWRLDALDKIGVSKIGWHKMQKKHGGYENRLDRPFL